MQLIESAKVVVDLSRQKVLHLLTHYSEEFMAHFFTDLDTPQSAERICDIMFQRCPHVWSFNNLTSGTECRESVLFLSKIFASCNESVKMLFRSKIILLLVLFPHHKTSGPHLSAVYSVASATQSMSRSQNFSRRLLPRKGTQRLLALPLFNNGKYADGNSRACRLIHSVMTESVGGRNSAAGSGAGGSHCEHLSFVPMADSKGRIKCQGRGRGLPFGMGFTEDELEMVQNYGDRTFFAGRSIGGGEGGGNYRSSSNNSGTSPRSSSPGSVLSEDAVVEERRSGRTSAARLGYRLIPPAGAPEEHQQLVQVQDEKTALTAWQHGLCPSFVRMWTDRADGRVHSPGQTTERTNQSSGPPILSRGGPIYGDATSDPNQVFFEELGGKRLYFTYDLGYLPFDVHVDGFGPGGIHAVCSSSTADFSTTGGDPVEVDVGGARPAHTLRREEKRLHTLVLLHGFPHYHIAWKRISTLLLSKGMQENHTRYNLVAFNLPGYYLSSASRDLRRMRLVSVAKAFFAAFRQMGLGAEGKPITLIGHDWGGAVAWAMLHLIGRCREGVALLHLMLKVTSVPPVLVVQSPRVALKIDAEQILSPPSGSFQPSLVPKTPAKQHNVHQRAVFPTEHNPRHSDERATPASSGVVGRDQRHPASCDTVRGGFRALGAACRFLVVGDVDRGNWRWRSRRGSCGAGDSTVGEVKEPRKWDDWRWSAKARTERGLRR